MTALRTATFGPFQVLDSVDVEKLSLLLAAVEPDELRKIKPEALNHLLPRAVELFSDEQLKTFTPDQVDHLNELSRAVYRQRLGIVSVGHTTKIRNVLTIVITSYLLLIY